MPTKKIHLPDCYLYPDFFDNSTCITCKYYGECKDIFNTEQTIKPNTEN